MKIFNLAKLTTAVALVISTQALADTYSYSELPTPADKVRNLFPIAVNDNGYALVLGALPEGLDIDLERVSTATRNRSGIPADIEDIENFELSYQQYSALVISLQDRVNSVLQDQRLGYYTAGTFDGQAVNLFTDFDDTDPETPEQANTVDHYLYGLNQNNIRVGAVTAPYRDLVHSYLPTTDATEEVQTVFAERDFTRRAVWTDGTSVKTYAPSETAVLGGESVMMDINDTNLAVGYASVALSPDAQERLTICEENAQEPTNAIPVYVCMWQRWHGLQDIAATNISFSLELKAERSIYDMRAMRWQLDANGNVISAEQLGTLLERGEEDTDDFSSYAYAINNNGIAVGQSWTYFEQDRTEVRGRIKMPAIFIGDEVLPVTTDTDYIWGSAVDINDNNVVTGFVIKNIQGLQRYVAFTYDIDTETFTELPGFFVGSSSIPAAINDDGLIVGSGEIEASLSTQRRRVGFAYDSTDTEARFINLNDTISCDNPYFIVDATGVNSNGQVVATAIEEGTYTDANGEQQVQQLVRSLMMNPIAGELNDCDTTERKVERQGAAVSPFALLGMLLIGGLITIRRLFTK